MSFATEFINNILGNFSNFPSFLRNMIDILLIAIVFYEVINIVRKSSAGQLAKGAVLFLIFYAIAYYFELRTVRWVLSNIVQIGFIAIVVIFQPELRRGLERMGRSGEMTGKLFGSRKMDLSVRGKWQSAIVAICDAAEQLSDTRTGALMVLERNNNLDEVIRTGTPLNADVIPEMLGTIFYEGTPLHDGAVVIRDGQLVAAGCVLPLSNNLEMGKDMGTRHRAALGMSENSDAVVLVVSEETGIISMAKSGILIRRLDRQNLFSMLRDEIVPPESKEEKEPSVWQQLFGREGASTNGKT